LKFKPEDFKGCVRYEIDPESVQEIIAARANGLLSVWMDELYTKVIEAIMIGPIDEIGSRLKAVFERA
jgi:hypothetical protein